MATLNTCLAVRLPAELVERLKLVAARDGRTPSRHASFVRLSDPAAAALNDVGQPFVAQ